VKIIAAVFDRMELAAERYLLYAACWVGVAVVFAAVEVLIYVTMTRMGAF
jgi:hypothetical protein